MNRVILLDDAAGGQYRFHDLTRLHAREMAEREESESARAEAIRRLLDWFLTGTSDAGSGRCRGRSLTRCVRYTETQRLLSTLGSLDEAQVRARLERIDRPGPR
jgi:hypothetical protein